MRRSALPITSAPSTSHRTARIAGPRAFNGLCDDEEVPLICPTCQILVQHPAGDCLLLCMGLFSIFLVGSHCTGPDAWSAAAEIPTRFPFSAACFGFETLLLILPAS